MINIVGDMSGKPKGYVPRGPKKNEAVRPATEEVKKELAAALPPTGQLEPVATVFKSPATAAMAAPQPSAAAAKPTAVKPPAVAMAAPQPSAAKPSAPMAAPQPSAPTPASDESADEADIPGRRYRTPRLAPGKEAASVNKYIAKAKAAGPYLQAYMDEQGNNEFADPYLTDEQVYMPPTRKAFNRFIRDTYSAEFTLPMQTLEDKSNACQKLFESAGKAGVETFIYQKFVREYIRQASPYRGMLVYHGLGSGKTCSAIAAAESLYGISDKKIIVMTPFSLRANFLGEIAFCGFSHYRLNNYWVALPIAKSETLRLYASKVLGLGDEYVARMMADKDDVDKFIWVPDFRPDGEAKRADPDDPAVYYADLPSEAQAKIRAQINAIINNRFEFINYNGVTAKTLKAWACEAAQTGVSKFDNAVIVVDEVHNLIRLMVNMVTPYTTLRPGSRRRVAVEPITPEPWVPSLCSRPDRNYKRGYLFYRLLTGARNSKIIGLSGTPLINFPEELGILSTVLAGYIQCADISIARDKALSAALTDILNKHPRIDYVKEKIADKNIVFTVSVFPEGYVKVMEGSNFRGIRYTEDEAAQAGIKEVVEEIRAKGGIPIADVKYKSEPRLPIDGDEFRDTFIVESEKGDLNAGKLLVLKKRLTGLVSYYKGSKEEYMPKVLEDTIVECPMSGHALTKYLAVRQEEIENDKSDAPDPKDKFKLVEVMSKAGSVSSYRFKSRATGNFAFPEAIRRPMPDDAKFAFLDGLLDDMVVDKPDIAEEVERESLVEGGVAAAERREEEDAAEAAAARSEDEATEAPEEEAAAKPSAAAAIVSAAASVVAGVTAAVTKAEAATQLSYQDLLEAAMGQLDEQRDSFFKLDPAAPEESQLSTYSRKLAEMLARIEAAPGSSLVYSQFKTVEGLGVLGIALKAAGYTEIKIVGSGEGFRFDDETRASILQGPGAKRFIKFTGEGTREQRALVLNIFNGNFSKLPSQIKEVFDEYDTTAAFEGKPTYAESRNLRGGICRVIGITGAGAEGISLKCVRAVHIFEAYWNNVRLDQVKGRAIRICSHADLPPEERNVRIYTYISTFPKGVQLPATIMLKDEGLTSDQFVLSVSEYKQNIIDKLFGVMKECAVDCVLNTQDNTDVDSCFVMEGASTQYSFAPNLAEDIIETAQDKGVQKDEARSLAAPAAGVAEETGRLMPGRGKRKTFEIVTLPGRDLVVGTYALQLDESMPDRFFIYEAVKDAKGKVTGPTGEKLGTIMRSPATGKYMRLVWFGMAAPSAGAAAGK